MRIIFQIFSQIISFQIVVKFYHEIYFMTVFAQIIIYWWEIQNPKMFQQLLKTATQQQKKPDPDQQDVDCVDTKIWLWDGDSYEQFQSDYLNQIFPYKLNKKTMTPNSQFVFHFLSASLHYWIQLIQEGQAEPEKLGKKDVKVISEILREDQSENCIAFHRWGQNFNKRQAFLKHQQAQDNFMIPEGGEIIHNYTRGEDEFMVVKYLGNNKSFSEFKARLQVLFLFYIDGVSFVFEELDTWIYYVIFKNNKTKKSKNVVGVLSKYVFRLSSIRQRHRVSQVFILPPYQKAGHGKELIDVVYGISLKDPKCFQITTEIPSFQYQCLRDYKEIQMLINSKILDLKKMKKVINKAQIDANKNILLEKQNVRLIKKDLKIPGHQIQRLTNILIYNFILNTGQDMPRAHFQQQIRESIIINRSPFKTRKFLPHITFYGKVPNLKDFLVEKAKEDVLRNQEEVQEIFLETLKGFMRVIQKMKKNNMIL